MGLKGKRKVASGIGGRVVFLVGMKQGAPNPQVETDLAAEGCGSREIHQFEEVG